MRDAFNRTSLSLNNETRESSKVQNLSEASPQMPMGEMPRSSLESAVIAEPHTASRVLESHSALQPPLTEIDAYNPLQEIAEAAKMSLANGRPVSILVLSVESALQCSGTVGALEQMLSKSGPALAAVLEPELMTKTGLLAATASVKDAMDFVIFNGGKVSERSRNLFDAVNLVVLVASDDLEDPRVDAAEEFLGGSDYFIVSEEPARPLARV
jgi:hypothetical protein